MLNTGTSSTPVSVPGLADAEEIALGKSHACARRSDGTVSCWGEGDRGQLGRPVTTPCPKGTSMCSIVPLPIAGVSRVKRIAAGGDTTCALSEDDSVRCWGANDNGQLGNGSTTDSFVPVLVKL
jgi:alpha-tubulin suppressor-like RCC1 family protein